MKTATAISVAITLCACLGLAQTPPTPIGLTVTTLSTTAIDDSIIQVPVQEVNGHFEARYQWPHTNGIWLAEGTTNGGVSFVNLGEWAELPPTREMRLAFTPTTNIYNWPPMWLGQRMAEVPDATWSVRLRKIATRP